MGIYFILWYLKYRREACYGKNLPVNYLLGDNSGAGEVTVV